MKTSISKNIGQEFSSNQLDYLLKSGYLPNRKQVTGKSFITFFHAEWENQWFEILINGKHVKFDDEIIMEFCRENFGHVSFGISDGEQAALGNAMRDNL